MRKKRKKDKVKREYGGERVREKRGKIRVKDQEKKEERKRKNRRTKE